MEREKYGIELKIIIIDGYLRKGRIEGEEIF